MNLIGGIFMNKIAKKSIWMLILSLALCFAVSSMSLAATAGWTPSINTEGISPTPPTGNGMESITEGIGKVLGAAQWIGLIVGIGMIIYIGVKYLTAGAGKKAEAKETAIPLLIGAGLVMLAPTIAQWVFHLFE